MTQCDICGMVYTLADPADETMHMKFHQGLLNALKFPVSTYECLIYRPLVKWVYQKINFLISQPKHMLWVLKRTVSMRQFF